MRFSKKFFFVQAGLWAVCAQMASISAFADGTHEEPSDSGSEFKLEKNLLEDIYTSALQRSAPGTTEESLGVGVGLSVLYPRELTLANSYYEVSWASARETYFMPYVSLGSTFQNWGWGKVGWAGRVGYSFHEGLYSLFLKNGTASSRDFLRMHWISGLGRLEFSVMSQSISWIRPVIFAGLGGQWIFQVGRIDGVNQGFLIPTYTTGLEMIFWDQSRFQGNWFSGARLGVSYMSAFASSQKLALVGVDFGASFIF